MGSIFRVTRNLGSVKISGSCLRDNLEAIREAFYLTKFMLLHVEYDHLCDSYTYEGTSPQFKRVGEGYMLRKYTLIISTQEDTLKAHFEEAKNEIVEK